MYIHSVFSSEEVLLPTPVNYVAVIGEYISTEIVLAHKLSSHTVSRKISISTCIRIPHVSKISPLDLHYLLYTFFTFQEKNLMTVFTVSVYEGKVSTLYLQNNSNGIHFKFKVDGLSMFTVLDSIQSENCIFMLGKSPED